MLASAFFRAGYVESWGRGIEKILSECRKHDIPPPLFNTDLSGLMLTFRVASAQLTESLGEFLVAPGSTTQETTQEIGSETIQEKIIALLRLHPAATGRDLAQQLGLTPDGIKYHLSKLRAMGAIRHVGPTKGGHWEVLK
ncbi:ATP-binding protein [Pseudomonas lijiangensis]|uniref:ATP-binding protein n=1 Tax=Pseudomonas syringae group TaxID=136849 RepID=UPI001E4C74DB|nr:ATP-binding protein [Pseudomonas cichorii]